MYSVRGKFANGHTFSISPAPGNTARDALAFVMDSDEIKAYGSPVVMVTVKALAGKKKIRISDEPAKPRDRTPTGAAAGNQPRAANAPAGTARKR
jgi:hypothetical protein